MTEGLGDRLHRAQIEVLISRRVLGRAVQDRHVLVEPDRIVPVSPRTVEGSHVQTRVPLQESLRLSEARRDETQRPSDLGYVRHPGREDDGTTAPPCRDEEWCEG